MNTQVLRNCCEKWIAIARQAQDDQHSLKNYYQKRYWIGIEEAYTNMLRVLNEEEEKRHACITSYL